MAIDYTGSLPHREADCSKIENLATNAVSKHIARAARSAHGLAPPAMRTV